MIALLGLIRSPVGIASCVALGLAISTALCFRAWQHAREEVGVAKAAIATAVSANASNVATVAELEQRLRDMVAARHLEQEQRDLALAQREREAQLARDEAAKLKRQLAEAWRTTSDCETLARVDLATVCPVVTDRLRERARRGRRDADGGGAGGDGAADPGAAHRPDTVSRGRIHSQWPGRSDR